MAQFNLERFKYNWRGYWEPGIEFKKDDIMYYQGKSYACLAPHIASEVFREDLVADEIDIFYNITVGVDTYSGQASGRFYLNNIENPDLILIRGRKYIFDQTDPSNVNYNTKPNIFLLSTIENGTRVGGSVYLAGTTFYLDNETVTLEQYIAGFSDASARKIEVILPAVAPDILHYFDKNYLNLGNKCNTRYASYWSLIFRGTAWLGDWQSEFTYAVGSLVKVNGIIYSCIKDHESGLIWEFNEEFWQVYSPSYRWTGNWTNGTQYYINDVVRYNGNIYYCTVMHLSAPFPSLEDGIEENGGLDLDITSWEPIHLADYWVSEWTPDTFYRINDIVKQQGRIYRCLTSHTSSGASALLSGAWELVLNGIKFVGTYTGDVFYSVNSVVKYGGTLFICVAEHTSNVVEGFIDSYWNVYVPGLEFENVYNETVNYNLGDIVLYGGYSYIALANVINEIPSTSSSWEIVATNYSVEGNWSLGKTYQTGDVVNDGGILYLAITDNEDAQPIDNNAAWRVIIPGINYRKEWINETDYIPSDLVLYAGTLYQCIEKHLSDELTSRPDIDIAGAATYWIIVIQGGANNRLATEGDIKTYLNGNTIRLPIGEKGSNLILNNLLFPAYQKFEEISNIVYVSMEGVDGNEYGTSPASPFRTVKYAAEYVLNNIDIDNTSTTIYVKTGVYEEILPIIIPKNCAIVGDELRSTVISAGPGYEESNMFYMRNGSGLRNLSLQGLYGTLGDQNEFFTRRPSAGAYVSLDPGTGPDDTAVWITTKSPYVQNVSTFGTGCVGMKVDGALHDGGNDSIVANDFTQILSDGIGFWADNLARSELVSVFTYYCHIGYLCTNGGILRSTNGNNSYGTYGSVAEGYDVNEEPITGNIDNKTEEAEFGEAITYGTTAQTIIAVGYKNAGESYTSASIEFGGAGSFASGYFDEFRYNAISKIRIEGPADSTDPGGTNYTDIVNTARSGSTTTIQLSAADDNTAADLIGQRIVIIAGKGVGQYGKISAYDEILKIATIERETNGVTGWDHFQPGWPLETTLNDTSRYEIEPCVDITDPDFITTTITPPSGIDWGFIKYTNNYWMATTLGTSSLIYAYSTNKGSSWVTGSSLGNYTPSCLEASADKFFLSLKYSNSTDPTDKILVWSDGSWSEVNLPVSDNWISVTTDRNNKIWVLSVNGIVAHSSNNGNTWNSVQLSGNSTEWSLIKYGREILIAIDGSDNLNIAKSVDNGTTWSVTPGLITIAAPTALEYGNGRFVMLSGIDTMFSFSGDKWYNGTLPVSQTYMSYGNGIFLASGDNQVVAKSPDGQAWYIANTDTSEQFALIQNTTWLRNSYGDGIFIIVNNAANVWSKIITGPKAVIRAKIFEKAIDKFIIYNPGGGYINQPTLTIIDTQNIVEVLPRIFLRSGVLGQPEMLNRGEGYTTTTAIITGDGFATNYQTGIQIKVKNLTEIPGPGANIFIDGIDDIQYSLSRVDSFAGTGPYSAIFTITPSIGAFESPADDTEITLRNRYSQIRLTGHDFLDVGTGNKSNSNYPDLYLFGETTLNNRQPENETYAIGGGRVFYTSTDQDGNFRVGELFKVDQASGIVTISATQFDLGGLSELSLGGIQLGGTAVIIREFSRDQFFVANSNNIVPTQKAIKTYIESRVTGGGSNATTNTLVAGNVIIEGLTAGTRTEEQINMEVKGFSLKGIDGHYLAILYQN